MASTSAHAQIYSALTLALLEDSGWYQSNFSLAEALLWGRGKGCAYVQSPCVSDNGATLLAGMCAVSNSVGCTADRRAKGGCNLVTWNGPLPAQFQYFNDPTLGGELPVMDYCPYYAVPDCDRS